MRNRGFLVRKLLLVIVACAVAAPLFVPSGTAGGWSFSPYAIPKDCLDLQAWYDELLATHEAGTAVPLEFAPTDAQLAKMGFPPRALLQDHRFPEPTLVTPTGATVKVPLRELQEAFEAAARQEAQQPPAEGAPSTTVATFAGTGCIGIRPGALLLNLNGGISLCSLAFVFGSAGNYDISTAGHCTKSGETVTVVAALGNRGGLAGPVLLDFGKTSNSIDGGVGKDHAMIDVFAPFQGLVTPTMCIWGGPTGTFTSTGSTASVVLISGNRIKIPPEISTNPNPFLVEPILHYGHGVGIGAGGTPRQGGGFHWTSTYGTFVGLIAPGDSGSGASVAMGDQAGNTREAGLIVTHIVVDPLLRTGIGIAAGTRISSIGTAANGQLLPYPAPVAGAP